MTDLDPTDETQTALGAAFHVNPATVSRIVRRLWRQEVA